MASPMSRYAGGNCPQGDPARIVLIGDSFATRFERYCRAHAIVNGGLDPRLISLSVVGKGGAHLGWVNDAASRISQSNATKAVITLGGNDLNNAICKPDQLAKELLNVARSLINVDGFQKVAICQLQYRYPPSSSRLRSAAARKYPLRPNYNSFVDQVNIELRRLTDFFPKNHVWKHRGLLLNYQDFISDDGVHVGPEGERKFFRSIRGAALFLSKC